MTNQRYSPELKDEAAPQVINHGYSVTEVSQRLGISAHSLYRLVKAVKPDITEQKTAELIEAKSEIIQGRRILEQDLIWQHLTKKNNAVQ